MTLVNIDTFAEIYSFCQGRSVRMSALPSCCVDIRVSTCGVTRSQIVWAAPSYFNGTIASYRCEYLLSFTIISENKICNKKNSFIKQFWDESYIMFCCIDLK